MKKTIVSILVVGCLLTTSIASVNAAVNPNQDEYANDENAPVPAGSDDFIDPIYFKKWSSDEFDKAEGVASTVLNGYLYVLVKVSDMDGNTEVNEHIAILKFQMDGGMLKKSVILDDPGVPRDVVAFKGYIYAIVLFGVYKDPALLKIDANDLNLEKRHDISGAGLEPEDIDVDDNYIYVAGNANKPYSIFLAKFDEYCNPEWEKYYSKQEIQAILPDGDGMAVYDNHIYLTGACIPIDTEDICPFLLKYDADNGALVDELIVNEGECFGLSVEGHDEKIYVCCSKWNGILEAFDLCVKSYDTDLDLKWQKTYELDEGLNVYFLEWGCDMVILDNYLYICGRVFGISGDEGFVLKCDINTHQKEWFKRIEGHSSWVYSIHVDTDSKLYLSGWAAVNDEYCEVFILKCNHNGGKNLALTVPVNLEITQQSSQQYTTTTTTATVSASTSTATTTTTSTTISGQSSISSSQSTPLSNPLVLGGLRATTTN